MLTFLPLSISRSLTLSRLLLLHRTLLCARSLSPSLHFFCFSRSLTSPLFLASSHSHASPLSLARALSRVVSLLEFTSELDRRSAWAVASAVGRACRQRGLKRVVFATAHDDVARFLQVRVASRDVLVCVCVSRRLARTWRWSDLDRSQIVTTRVLCFFVGFARPARAWRLCSRLVTARFFDFRRAWSMFD